MNKITKLAITDLKANKGRNKLTLISIVMAVFLVYVIMTVAGSFHQQMVNEMKIADDDVLTIAFGAGENALNYKALPLYTDEDIANVKNIEGISNIVGVKATNLGSLKTENNKSIFTSTIYGVDDLYYKNLNLKLSEGKLPKGNEEVVVGANIKKASNLNIGDNIIVQGKDGEFTLKVVGVVEHQKEQTFSTLPTEINQMIAMSKESKYVKDNNYMYIYAKADDVNKIEDTSKAIISNLNLNKDLIDSLEGTGMNVLVASKIDVLKMINNWFMYINLFVAVLAILISIISAINIINIMAISIRDKFKDIAVFKIVGGTEGQVKGIFIRESIILGVIGSVIGILLGVIVSTVAISILNWPSGFSFIIFIFSLLIGVVTASVSGYIVSNVAGKAKISIILNGE